MAGRGTDIKLGEGVSELGGLHVIGCQRHESRRIDNQLLGRAGRQGDPGSSQFYLSMEDDLLRIFGGARIAAVMDRLGMEEGQAIEHEILSASIRRAQKRVEGRNFEIRKHLLEYDLVLAKQREAIYALRNRFLLPSRDQADRISPDDINDYLNSLFDDVADQIISEHIDTSKPSDEWNLDGLTRYLSSYLPVDSKNLVGMNARQLQEAVVDVFQRAYLKQKQRFKERFPLIAHYIVLKMIDEAWLSHLYTLDDLKEGIGLTAYAGTDPLVVFKRESYVLFEQMLANAAQKIVGTMLSPRLTIKGDQQPQPEQKMPNVSPEKSMNNVTSTAPQPQKKAAHTKKTPGRNDPCPCGSGKKYKNCCGKNT
jgi:preprotein translocase subunit SecA